MKRKGTNGYVAELNSLVRKEYGEVPAKLTLLIRKTAKDMLVMDTIAAQLLEVEEIVSMEIGSKGQPKQIVTPLLPYYDKLSSRVTDDLYNLGLTARRQAVKSDDLPVKSDDPLIKLANALK
jgi:hypothetical protein